LTAYGKEQGFVFFANFASLPSFVIHPRHSTDKLISKKKFDVNLRIKALEDIHSNSHFDLIFNLDYLLVFHKCHFSKAEIPLFLRINGIKYSQKNQFLTY